MTRMRSLRPRRAWGRGQPLPPPQASQERWFPTRLPRLTALRTHERKSVEKEKTKKTTVLAQVRAEQAVRKWPRWIWVETGTGQCPGHLG